MPTVLITGTNTSTVTINNDNPHLLVPDAVVAASGIGIDVTNYYVYTQPLTIAGTVIGSGNNYNAIRLDGNDTLVISQTGQVFAYGDNTGSAISLRGGNRVTVNGTVFSDRVAISGFGLEDEGADSLTIGVNGFVSAGESGGTAAILMGTSGADTAELTNYGVIHMAAPYGVTNPTAVNNTQGRMEFTNHGEVRGDVMLNASNDVVFNTGVIIGDLDLGMDNDRYDGRGGLVSGEVTGGEGDDEMIGGIFSDVFLGGDEDDRLFGREGSDFLSGGEDEDELHGGAGADQLLGGDGDDTLQGGSGNDDITGGEGFDDIFGDSGNDVIRGGTGNDIIDGGSGDDNIDGEAGDDQMVGNSGHDTLRGDAGEDTITGGSGDDVIAGGSGNDELNAGSGHDRIYAGAGDDTLEGTTGDDLLNGGFGDDVLSGGSNNDTLDGDAGQDLMRGGNGADVFDFNAISDSASGASTRDRITDFQTGQDQIDLSGIGTLTFVNSFSGTAGEVRYNDTVGRLYVDMTGSATSDLQIDLGAGAGLTEEDLIL